MRKMKSYKQFSGRSLLLAAMVLVGLTASPAADDGNTPQKLRIVLVGDSTVTDHAGWGLGFKQSVTGPAECINTARGGRSSRSFIDEGHWTNALALKGDYYLIQFGHNDQPGKGPKRETDPETTYTQFMARYVDEARAIGATPILVTSLVRRKFEAPDDVRIRSTLTPYVDAVKRLAAERDVPVIDLHASSKALCEQLGREGCYAFSPVNEDGSYDTTHLNAKGRALFAQLVVAPLRDQVPELQPVLLEPPVEDRSDAADTSAGAVDDATMQRIHDEVRTPFKYGVVIEPPAGKKVDCPNVFRHGDKWYMVHVQMEKEPQGYSTQLAESDDLLNWRPLGTILPQGPSNAWDFANAGGGVALFDTTWGGSHALQTYDDRYWMSYIGGPNAGYEKLPLSIGMAFTDNPSAPRSWQRLPEPVLRHDDADARPFESDVLYKSFIFRDPDRTLGAPFVMFYNARPPKGDEVIGLAVSHNMTTWTRYGKGPVLANARPANLKHGVISGDPQIFRMNGVWVMFYFGAFWKEGAFDTFAASHDLVHWTQWEGEDLIQPSEPWDTPFAHKPWLIKHDGVVYHFYCAVGGKNQHRTIALATSKDLGKEGASRTQAD